MKYVPLLFSLESEVNALKQQSYTSNVSPFIQIVKDIKVKGGKKSILPDIEDIIMLKPNNTFFITVPQNLNLEKKLKSPIESFFASEKTNPSYELGILNRFAKLENVIPVIEVNFSNYLMGDLKKKKSAISSINNTFAYRVNKNTYSTIQKELENIVTSKDFIIYDLERSYLYDKGKVRHEIAQLQNFKKRTNCSLIVVKQIYEDLTFKKMPNSKIISGHEAYDCIDSSFYSDFKSLGFDAFGDWAGIRNIPIYDGGMPYPAYLTMELTTFDHHGFKGKELDANSFETILLPNYLNSSHWNTILTPKYKSACSSCKTIENFKAKLEKINSAPKWKTITVSHFLKAMDYKIKNKYI